MFILVFLLHFFRCKLFAFISSSFSPSLSLLLFDFAELLYTEFENFLYFLCTYMNILGAPTKTQWEWV